MKLKKQEVFKDNYKRLKQQLTRDVFRLVDKSKWRYPECL